jgi:adenylate kinase
MTTPAPAPASSETLAAATTLFNAVWARIEAQLGAAGLSFPRQLVWLNGAPGAGKGTNTPLLLKELGITAQPVVTSDLLTSPECQAIKASGGLVDDTTVASLLFKKLTEAQFRDGAMIDGFPRTRVQAECVRMFRDRLAERAKAAGTPAPVFRFVVLQVTEQQAVERQLKRGREIVAANEKVKATGQGQLQELRPTDTDPAAAAKRYQVFCEATVAALEAMRGQMAYHLIDATGDLPTVQGKIVAEFRGKI